MNGRCDDARVYYIFVGIEVALWRLVGTPLQRPEQNVAIKSAALANESRSDGGFYNTARRTLSIAHRDARRLSDKDAILCIRQVGAAPRRPQLSCRAGVASDAEFAITDTLREQGDGGRRLSLAVRTQTQIGSARSIAASCGVSSPTRARAIASVHTARARPSNSLKHQPACNSGSSYYV